MKEGQRKHLNAQIDTRHLFHGRCPGPYGDQDWENKITAICTRGENASVGVVEGNTEADVDGLFLEKSMLMTCECCRCIHTNTGVHIHKHSAIDFLIIAILKGTCSHLYLSNFFLCVSKSRHAEQEGCSFSIHN